MLLSVYNTHASRYEVLLVRFISYSYSEPQLIHQLRVPHVLFVNFSCAFVHK